MCKPQIFCINKFHARWFLFLKAKRARYHIPDYASTFSRVSACRLRQQGWIQTIPGVKYRKYVGAAFLLFLLLGTVMCRFSGPICMGGIKFHLLGCNP